MTPAAADSVLRLCEGYGSYGSYAEEATNEVAFAPSIAQRFDAAANFVKTGGRFARREDPAVLAARTNYFRETYAYGETRTEGSESLLHHEGLIEAAQKVHDRPLVVPNIVYANLLVPGQELAVHTDVPEFRGANRKRYPQWLLVVMPYYPHGPDAPAETLSPSHNTAIVLDSDSVFHGVDRITETQPLPALRPGMHLTWEDDQTWRVGPPEAPLARYRWDEVRFSVSWKAYCYADEAERRATQEHDDDLELSQILGRLVDDLRQRERLSGDVPGDEELALLLIEEYIRFPAPAAG
jgi:hypothetical protein